MKRSRLPLLCLLILLSASLLPAQPRGRVPPYLQNPDRLDADEGARVIRQFRQIGLMGDFVFTVQLVHEPYRGAARTYPGTLAGEWGVTPRTRLELAPLPGENSPRHFLQWNGPEARIWAHIGDQTRLLTADQLHQPLLPGITITPFDLQMPFIYWNDYVYEGSRRLRGRGVHFFLLYPPESDPRYAEMGGVRVAIDADFNVTVRAETLDLDGNVLKRLEVQSVKKVQEQWIVRRIDLIDLQTRDRTRLEVQAARLALDLPDRIFEPEGLAEPLPEIKLQPL